MIVQYTVEAVKGKERSVWITLEREVRNQKRRISSWYLVFVGGFLTYLAVHIILWGLRGFSG